MTTQEMHMFFDIIQDKYASPYFEDDEKDLILTRAQIAVVEDFLPSNYRGMLTTEESSVIFENLDDITYELNITIPSGGEVLKSTIQTALNTASGNTEPYLVILNVSRNNKPCKWVRHNDWYKFQNNTFKSATDEEPQYKILNDKLEFLPSTSQTGTITVLKRPIDIKLGLTESELPDSMHNKIVALGIEIAGIASRDEALMAIQNIQK